MPARGDEFIECGEGARDDEVEKRLRPPGLDSSLMHFDIAEAELDRGLAQERRFLLARLRQCHVPARPRDGERNAGQAGARAGIGQARCFLRQRQVRQHGEGIEQVMRHHGERLADCGQVVGAVPFRDQRGVLQQPLARAGGKLQREFAEPAVQRGARRHALFLSAARKPRFKCTSRSEIAAGVTPEMRAA